MPRPRVFLRADLACLCCSCPCSSAPPSLLFLCPLCLFYSFYPVSFLYPVDPALEKATFSLAQVSHQTLSCVPCFAWAPLPTGCSLQPPSPWTLMGPCSGSTSRPWSGGSSLSPCLASSSASSGPWCSTLSTQWPLTVG